MLETRYVQDFGSETTASVRPWSGLVIHLDPRERAKITQHILTFNQTAIRCMGRYKEVHKVKETVGVIDLADKDGGGRSEGTREPGELRVKGLGQGELHKYLKLHFMDKEMYTS